jgi:hypothetical protein
MSMINVLNGIVTDDQEIIYEKNKESALKVLSLHKFVPGEMFIVGYYTEKSTEDNKTTDIMVAIGVEEGRGPEKYRIIADKRVVVVTSVLDELPDVSTIVFDQRYVARDTEDGKLYYLSRTHSQTTDEIIYEKTEILDKCTIMDASTGEIYICNPPEIVSFFDVIVKPLITEITNDNGDVSVSISSGDKTYSDLHFVDSEEKNYIISKVFEKNFEASVSYQKYDKKGEPTSSVDPCVVTKTIYTLVAKYSGENIKLDNTPDGWTFDEKTISYKKEITSNLTTSSGDITCIYTKGSYTGQSVVPSVLSIVYKYFFILYSDASLPTVDDLIRTGQANLVSSPKGSYTIQPRNNLYTWFCFPVGMEPSDITQFGVSYIESDVNELNGVTWKQINLGTYTLYRSLNTGNGSKQNIVIS